MEMFLESATGLREDHLKLALTVLAVLLTVGLGRALLGCTRPAYGPAMPPPAFFQAAPGNLQVLLEHALNSMQQEFKRCKEAVYEK